MTPAAIPPEVSVTLLGRCGATGDDLELGARLTSAVVLVSDQTAGAIT